MNYHWNLSYLSTQLPVILEGLLGTLRLSVVCLLGGLIIGTLVGAARSQGGPVLRAVGTAYVEFFRNIPALVQVFWCFYALPVLLGTESDRFLSATLAISLYSGAYFAEIVRSGIQSIEKGQWEAGRAIGMSYLRILRFIVFPQVFKRILPALTNQGIDVIKLTTLASTIAYAELLYQAKLISDVEFRPIETYTTIGGIFIAVLIIFSLLSARLERRMARSE
ncbi:ABC transporter permease protein [Paraburkholderia piptadeniae]|uniref:Glutamate/aspartate import permease protein GltK n=1 Tax=Paraburkholderia piptadeniae TaxID=1701573 RepID=A0A1N7SPS6_9BURK|nr:amino acid ABC transporter permease [Paraburkholderia piptadeniae]SIT49423.1 ABC transporter permease protein [Paraburkholderia piptadeniae]